MNEPKIPYASVYADHDPEVMRASLCAPCAEAAAAICENEAAFYGKGEAADGASNCAYAIRAAASPGDLSQPSPHTAVDSVATNTTSPPAPDNDDAEVLFALEMALEHDERHQALALRTWLPRIRQWAQGASRKPDDAMVKRLRVYARHSSQAVAHDLLAAADALSAQGGEQTGKLCKPCAEKAARICKERGDKAFNRASNPEKFMANRQGDPVYYSSHQEGIAKAHHEDADAILAAAKEGK